MSSPAPVGALLREWRQRRHLSQLDLACDANVSSRHLSFIETGRSQPSREMILQLAERLRLPLRATNQLLTAGGFAQSYPERALNHPDLEGARQAIEAVLAGHEPYPALAVDRHWTLQAANRALAPMLEGVPAALLAPPVNVLRLSLHPEGLAPRILNLPEWRAHVFARLRRQIENTWDDGLSNLLAELTSYPPSAARQHTAPGVVVPLQMRVGPHVVDFISTTMVFGTPLDVTLEELAIEAFYPADERSAAILRNAFTPHP